MFSALIAALDRNTSATLLLARMQGLTMQEMDNLTAAVSAETTVEASAIKMIEGFAAQAKASANDPAAVQALADKITASSTALAAAMTANTQASPAATTDAGAAPGAASVDKGV